MERMRGSSRRGVYAGHAGVAMIEHPLFACDYDAAATRATCDLKAKTLLWALMCRLRDVFSDAGFTLSVTFKGGTDPHVIIRDETASISARVTIDAESGLYVFCELGFRAADIVLTTANENRLIEEIAIHLRGDSPVPQTIDAAVSALVGQTAEDVERKLVLQTLHHCDGDPTHTAFMLGMPLVVLCNKLAVYFADSARELPEVPTGAGQMREAAGHDHGRT